MKEQLIRDWMTTNLITISPTTPLPEAHQLMMENNIRRLPVMWRGQLIGILTSGDIREARPSEASSISIYELNYLLDRLSVKEIMTTHPITVHSMATVGEAAQLMLEYKIGGLPVVDDGELVGIITETDFCRLLVAQKESVAISLQPLWV